MKQCYKIANFTVEMDTFGKTEAQALPYLWKEPCQPDMVVCGNWEQVKQQAPHLSDESCEYIGTGANFYLQLLEHGGMMLHASAVMMDGKAYLFTAPSGTGKSTHTQLWLQQFGRRAQILNDDKPALRLENGVWYAYGTPWSGKSDLNTPARAVLAGICSLRRGECNRIAPMEQKKAIYRILDQTLRFRQQALTVKLLERLDQLVSAVPIWELECNMEPQAALVSYRAMSGSGKE